MTTHDTSTRAAGTDAIDTERPLSALLRDGSAAEHKEAENSPFMEQLLAGRIDPAHYAQYLGRLRMVYEALERLGRELENDPVAGVVVDRRLDRLDAIDADIAFWTKGADVQVTSPATQNYVARIEATARDPKLYVAHHYTRYLGDLSGGQVIGRLLTRDFGLSDGEGVRFYAFADIPKPKPYKDAYRERLDALPLTASEKDAVLRETRDVFALNGAVFDELNDLVSRVG